KYVSNIRTCGQRLLSKPLRHGLVAFCTEPMKWVGRGALVIFRFVEPATRNLIERSPFSGFDAGSLAGQPGTSVHGLHSAGGISDNHDVSGGIAVNRGELLEAGRRSPALKKASNHRIENFADPDTDGDVLGLIGEALAWIRCHRLTLSVKTRSVRVTA